MNYEQESKYLKIALLISALMLCVAVLPQIHYGYYSILKLVVCGAAIYAAVILRGRDDLKNHFITLAVLALIFNPVAPVFLSREFEIIIEIGTAVYFLTLSKKI